ncbi:MFS transporter [Streptosporangium sp. NPDC001559]|uniref:MFS transporter n=1 Tax=Streptosporangium sp. NPDC001559 TaxID=3366187 RepID=UPI0036E89DB9
MPSSPPPRRDRRARVATWAAFLVQGLCFATLITHVIDLQHRFGLGDDDLMLVLLLVPVVAGAGSAAVAPLAARYGSAPVLRVSQLAVCVVVALSGWNDGLAGLYALCAAFGLFVGAVDAAMNMQAVAVERRYGMSVLSGFHAVWSVGSMLGAAVNSAFSALGVSLGWSFTAPVLAGAVLSAVALPGLYDREEELHGRVARDTAGAARVPWRSILPLCLAMAFLYVGDAAVSSYSTLYMSDALAASGWLVPFAYLLYQAAMLLARVPGDLAVRRYGPAPVVRAGAVIAAAGTAGVVVAPGVVVAVLAFGLIGVGLSVIAPQSFSAAGRLGAGAETAIARVNVFNYVGFLVGAAVVGGVNDGLGPRWAFVPAAVLVALIVPLAGGFRLSLPAGPAQGAVREAV